MEYMRAGKGNVEKNSRDSKKSNQNENYMNKNGGIT